MKSIGDTLAVIRSAVTEFERATNNEALVALIGGYAVIFHGVERTTLDVDVCFYAGEKRHGVSFYAFLKKYLPPRFKIRFMEASKDPSDPLKHDLIIINDKHGEHPRIDILMVRYQWELEGLRKAKLIDKFSFPIMPLPYLLAMKLKAGGRKDELDALEILQGMPEREIKKTKELARKIGRDKKFQTLLDEIARVSPLDKD